MSFKRLQTQGFTQQYDKKAVDYENDDDGSIKREMSSANILCTLHATLDKDNLL